MKYAFIREHAEAYPVRVLCRVLEVSPSGYYGWQRRPVSRREEHNRALMRRVVQIHRASYETYGYLRVHAELQAEGESCGKHRVARLMRRAGLKTRVQVLRERSRRGRTFEHVQENRLNRGVPGARTESAMGLGHHADPDGRRLALPGGSVGSVLTGGGGLVDVEPAWKGAFDRGPADGDWATGPHRGTDGAL